MFNSVEQRAIEYNARASAPDFDAEMGHYHALAEAAKSRIAGIYDIQYGPTRAKRLDVFPAQGNASHT